MERTEMKLSDSNEMKQNGGESNEIEWNGGEMKWNRDRSDEMEWNGGENDKMEWNRGGNDEIEWKKKERIVNINKAKKTDIHNVKKTYLKPKLRKEASTKKNKIA